MVTELQAMRISITLAALRLGATSPNPPVGCVILSPEGTVLGAGYHTRKGEPHAEVNALRAAGERARGATAVVTLEPCNHVGRTSACHQALIDAGISRVVVALIDPTSRGEGGIARLRQAGVEVEVGLAAAEARILLEPWLRSVELGRPTVTVGSVAINSANHAEAAWARLREWAAPGVDVIVDQHGKVTEAVPGSHRDDVLQLPSTPLPHDPRTALTTLHAAGARRVLVLSETVAQSPFITQADRLLVLTCEPATPSLDSMPVVPDSWSVQALHPVQAGLITEYHAG